jgi:hypothetical protein
LASPRNRFPDRRRNAETDGAYGFFITKLFEHAFLIGNNAMHEHENIQYSDTAQILSEAHLRRSADIGAWLKQFLGRYSRMGERAQGTSYLRHGLSSLVTPTRHRAI